MTMILNRRKRRRFVWLGGALVLGSAAVYLALLFAIADGAVPVTRRVAEPDGRIGRIRLLNFNVLHGYPHFEDQETRYDRLVEALGALDPTVIVLQEAWRIRGYGHLAERLGADLGLDVAYARANGSRRLIGFEEGSAVLSRLPIADARRLVLLPRRPLWEARIALFVHVSLGRGATLPIIGTHLTSHGPHVTGPQARYLAARLPSDDLAIAAGDLNARSGSVAVSVFEERGFEDVVPGGVDHVLVRTAGWKVDHAAWTLRAADLGELIGKVEAISDHPGIVVDLELRRPGEAARVASPPP